MELKLNEINNSLNQLVKHLSIPSELNDKLELVKAKLNHLNALEDLNKLINELTELLISSYGLQQLKFKKILRQVTDQLYDFDSFLNQSLENQDQSEQDSQALECGIQHNINQIKNDLDGAFSIQELTSKVNQSLGLISERITNYRANEERRREKSRQQMSVLQEKLAASEGQAEEMRVEIYFQQLRVNRDPLTEVANRLCYDERISDIFERWKSKTRCDDLSMAIADIDHFKKINDRYGHLAGDKVLKKVAALFKESIRSVDFVARLGGEEFVFIFERTPIENVRGIMEKVRTAVETCPFVYQDNKVDVTVSIGLTAFNEHDDKESLFARTDKAMYKAKEGGRNRLEFL